MRHYAYPDNYRNTDKEVSKTALEHDTGCDNYSPRMKLFKQLFSNNSSLIMWLFWMNYYFKPHVFIFITEIIVKTMSNNELIPLRDYESCK